MRSKVVCLLLLVIMSGCYRPPDFPDIPQIQLERITLTDEADILLTFNVRDGDGDIGLASTPQETNLAAAYPEGADGVVLFIPPANAISSDLLAPYHNYSMIVDADGNVVTNISDDHVPPFYEVPVIQYPILFQVLYFNGDTNQQSIRFETSSEVLVAGDQVLFSEIDERPVEYDCNVYEIVPINRIVSDTFMIDGQQGTFIDQVIEIVGYDTVFVTRNELYNNLHLDIEVKQGNDYVLIEDFYNDIIEPCDPLYTSRFPVFDYSDIGRPLDGSIDYRIISTQFLTGPILQETIRFRFYIYDRAFNKSNEVITPDFNIIDLRAGDLTP